MKDLFVWLLWLLFVVMACVALIALALFLKCLPFIVLGHMLKG